MRFFHCYKRGVDRVFVDHPLFLEKVVFLLFSFHQCGMFIVLYRIEFECVIQLNSLYFLAFGI